ncbi:BcrAD-BadFG domain-containing protein [Plantibacter sp. RU18]
MGEVTAVGTGTAPAGAGPAGAARPATTRLVVAVDGGGSKTEVVVMRLDGTVVGRARGAGSSPHFEGLERSAAIIDALVREAIGPAVEAMGAGDDVAVTHAGVYLSGLDLPVEMDAYRDALEGSDWFPAGSVVDNDLFALLRAGTDAPDAVAVVCGTGINALGVRADGETARFAALGGISGDWGGGWFLGEQALWHAARAVDGRGPATALADLVPTALGLGSVQEVIETLHFERLPHSELIRLSPVLFTAAEAGDAVAAGVIDRQAEEIVLLATAAIHRLGLQDTAVPVVLGGGVLAARDERLLVGVTAGLAREVPRAVPVVTEEQPVAGAAALALASALAGIRS